MVSSIIIVVLLLLDSGTMQCVILLLLLKWLPVLLLFLCSLVRAPRELKRRLCSILLHIGMIVSYLLSSSSDVHYLIKDATKQSGGKCTYFKYLSLLLYNIIYGIRKSDNNGRQTHAQPRFKIRCRTCRALHAVWDNIFPDPLTDQPPEINGVGPFLADGC